MRRVYINLEANKDCARNVAWASLWSATPCSRDPAVRKALKGASRATTTSVCDDLAHVSLPTASGLQLSVTADGIRVLTAARKVVVELEERRLAPIGGQRSRRSIDFKETLAVLLREQVEDR